MNTYFGTKYGIPRGGLEVSRLSTSPTTMQAPWLRSEAVKNMLSFSFMTLIPKILCNFKISES